MTTKPDAEKPAGAHCPECGAAIAFRDTSCWLCKRSLVVNAELAAPQPAADVQVRKRGPQAGGPVLQFSIETLLLVTTLVAVCLGVSLSAPGLGIPLSFVAAPALIRTLIAGHQERAVGRKLSLGEKVLTFLASTGIMVAVIVAGGAAFFVTCSTLLLGGLAVNEMDGSQIFNKFGETLIWLLIAVSSVTGLAVAGWIFWLTRPRKGDRY